jgi:hypothetical protein
VVDLGFSSSFRLSSSFSSRSFCFSLDLGEKNKTAKAWDRCSDFLNIFAEKFGEKNGVFDSKQS